MADLPVVITCSYYDKRQAYQQRTTVTSKIGEGKLSFYDADAIEIGTRMKISSKFFSTKQILCVVTGNRYLREGTWEIDVKIDSEAPIVAIRKEPRENIALFIRYSNGRKDQGTVTIDVSRRGLAFYSPEPFRPGARVQIEMEKTRTRADAVVKNTKELSDRAWRVGVQLVCIFRNAPPENHQDRVFF